MKRWFAIGSLTLVGSFSFAQTPEDTLTYYEWETVQNADPDTVYAITFKRERLHKLPDELAQFKQLRGLRLTKNKLTELPSYFASFKQMRFFYIDKNRLNHFPAVIFHMEELVVLNVSRNEIRSIPKGIKNLTQLKYLDAWDNRFTSIDPDFSKLQQLEYIDLRGTTFAPSFVEHWTNAFPNAQVEFDKPCDCLE